MRFSWHLTEHLVSNLCTLMTPTHFYHEFHIHFMTN